MPIDAHNSDRQLDPSGDPRPSSDGASPGSSGGRSRRTVKARVPSDDAGVKEALRLFAKRGRLTKQERIDSLQASFGVWKDRPEWKGMSSAQILQELRRTVTQRRRNA